MANSVQFSHQIKTSSDLLNSTIIRLDHIARPAPLQCGEAAAGRTPHAAKLSRAKRSATVKDTVAIVQRIFETRGGDDSGEPLARTVLESSDVPKVVHVGGGFATSVRVRIFWSMHCFASRLAVRIFANCLCL